MPLTAMKKLVPNGKKFWIGNATPILNTFRVGTTIGPAVATNRPEASWRRNSRRCIG